MSSAMPVILLAAGNGSRAGAPKALIAVAGEPFLERQLRSIGHAGASRVVVVLGHHLTRHLKEIPWLEEARTTWVRRGALEVRVAVNRDPARGMFSSLREGLAHALGGAGNPDGVFVLPIDVPCPAPEVWRAIATELKGRGRHVAVPHFDGRGGHPCLLSGEFARRLSEIPLDAEGARLDRQIRALPTERYGRVPVSDAGVLRDLDEPSDWESYLKEAR